MVKLSKKQNDTNKNNNIADDENQVWEKLDTNKGYKFYGNKYGKKYIEIHHLKQLADSGKEYQIDPIKDLRPVCANCHRMLHKQRPPISIEELQIKIQN